MSDAPTPAPDVYPAIRKFMVRICEGCLDGKGEMCSTPGCIFCWRSTAEINEALDMMLIRPVIDGERLIADEGEPE